jgi:hypothetical protein
MKIRTGFVSNSSSSSFCIYGVYLESDELMKHFERPENAECYDSSELEEDIWDKMNEMFSNKSGVDWWGPNDTWDGWYIGSSLLNCADDQTMGDFKDQVRYAINAKAKIEIPKEEFSMHAAEYYS